MRRTGRIKAGFRRIGLYIAAVLMVGAFPVSIPPALAEALDQAAQPAATTESADTSSNTAAAPSTQTTTTAPTTTSTQAPATYDATTGRWNTDQWQYSSQTDNYQPVPVAQPTATQPVVSSDTPATSVAQETSSPVSNTPTANTNSTTATGIGNNLQSTATTGNAGVISNTTGGSAGTGNALAQTTQTNIVNSSLSGGLAPATFTSNINGDVNGDIMLYPTIMAALLQTAAAPTANTSITATNDAAINNNLNLAATSGDATVANNTTAGGATTGDASAVANVINMINSVIASGSSFIGTINIYGNLTGDILVSPDFLPQLLAANQGSTSGTGNLTANLSDTQSIVNNINLAAISGNASVTGNTTAGSATSGGAATNLVLLNLTGHQVVAKDSLLVFVNVLGTWVGMIVDAAPGSTSAALGNGVTSDTVVGNTKVDASNTSAITNNLTLNAKTGDATVTGNTTAGDATTGRATASANVANIAQTNIGLTGWFGVLFINVFGSWLGSFGVDTPYGNPTQATGGASEPGRGSVAEAAPSGGQAIRFVAHQALSSKAFPLPFVHSSGSTTGGENSAPVIAASNSDDTTTPPSGPQATATGASMAETLAPKPTPTLPTIVPFSMVMLTLTLAGVALRRLISVVGAITLAS